MINELLVSPGCTLAVIIIAFLCDISSSDDSKLVINNKSRSLPARDFVSKDLLIIVLGVLFISLPKYYCKSVYV
jgi:hypothetical protein